MRGPLTSKAWLLRGRYNVEVYRFGGQVVPMMTRESDHSIRFTNSSMGGIEIKQGGRFAEPKADSGPAAGSRAPTPATKQAAKPTGKPTVKQAAQARAQQRPRGK